MFQNYHNLRPNKSVNGRLYGKISYIGCNLPWYASFLRKINFFTWTLCLSWQAEQPCSEPFITEPATFFFCQYKQNVISAYIDRVINWSNLITKLATDWQCLNMSITVLHLCFSFWSTPENPDVHIFPSDAVSGFKQKAGLKFHTLIVCIRTSTKNLIHTCDLDTTCSNGELCFSIAGLWCR